VKRKISFLLALTMVLMAIPFNSFAQQNYDKQLKEAIIKSKELFNIGKEYDRFSHDINSYDDDTIFYLNWSDSKGKLGNIDVAITLDGTVMSYGKWKPSFNERKPKLPKISKEEGLNIAKDFIKKVSPRFASNIKYVDISAPLNIDSEEYDYYFIRTENGIPYYNNRINIFVDNSTGEVRNYHVNWELDLVFPDSKDIISLEKAQELYKEKIGLSLLYKSNYIYRLDYPGKTPEIYLAYGPLDTDLGINAKDGEVAALNDYFRLYDRAGGMGNEAAKEAELNPGEKKAIEDITGLISKKDAENIGREILGLDSKYKLGEISLYKNWRCDDAYNWRMDFMKDLDSEEYYADINIDAKTGELVSFYKYGTDNLDKKVKYNKEQALNIAKEYIKKRNPEKFSDIELKKEPLDFNSSEEPKNYYFKFIRKIDNAYVQDEGISVLVDVTEGEITEYRIDWSKGEFPPQTNLISIEKAYNILFNDIGMELKYINPYRYGRRSEENKKVILVYGLKSEKPANIDANTGTILDYNGEPFKKPTITSYNDIDKSYAKDKINILSQYGIILPGEKFRPKEKINQRDFLCLLSKASNPYIDVDTSEDKLYNYMINVGIIKEDEKAPKKIVTKEEGIKYIVRAMKYDKIADLIEIYKDLFKDTKDIDPKLKGYVSIAYGLGIVQGNNGYLNPKAELKREDGANMIYNYLFSGN
jgi:hypothetical protein